METKHTRDSIEKMPRAELIRELHKMNPFAGYKGTTLPTESLRLAMMAWSDIKP